MTSQALATLTATYTDSEVEEDTEDELQTPDKKVSRPTHSEPNSPKKYEETYKNQTASAPPTPKVLKRLVSYGMIDDTIVSDDEATSPRGADDTRHLSIEVDIDEAVLCCDADNFQDDAVIPPEPPGKCPQELQNNIAKFYARMINEGFDMNKIIQDRKNFRNPSIYEKLIQFCDINELDTNYPPEIYDPLRWGKESYYDELARVQKIEMDRREKERKEKAKIDIISGISKKSVNDEEKKKKSKWDQAAPNVAAKPFVKQPSLVQQPLTNVTRTIETIISGFGSLPKKPKA